MPTQVEPVRGLGTRRKQIMGNDVVVEEVARTRPLARNEDIDKPTFLRWQAGGDIQ